MKLSLRNLILPPICESSLPRKIPAIQYYTYCMYIGGYITMSSNSMLIAEREARQQIWLRGEKCELAYIYLSVTLQECNYRVRMSMAIGGRCG